MIVRDLAVHPSRVAYCAEFLISPGKLLVNWDSAIRGKKPRACRKWVKRIVRSYKIEVMLRVAEVIRLSVNRSESTIIQAHLSAALILLNLRTVLRAFVFRILPRHTALHWSDWKLPEIVRLAQRDQILPVAIVVVVVVSLIVERNEQHR